MTIGPLIAVMAIVTMALRFLPFIIFRKRTPAYISFLGRVLPPAIIGMLVVYCLRDVSVSAPPHGVPELIASLSVIGLQILKRSAVLSILGGTVVYMLLVQMVF